MTMYVDPDGNTIEDEVECRYCHHVPSQVLGGTCGSRSARFRCTSETCGREFAAALPSLGVHL